MIRYQTKFSFKKVKITMTPCCVMNRWIHFVQSCSKALGPILLSFVCRAQRNFKVFSSIYSVGWVALGFLDFLNYETQPPVVWKNGEQCQKNPHAMNYRFEISCLLVNSCSIYTFLIPIIIK